MTTAVDSAAADRIADLRVDQAYGAWEGAVEELIRIADLIVPDGVGDDIMVPWTQMSGTALWQADRAGMPAAGIELRRRARVYERRSLADTVSV